LNAAVSGGAVVLDVDPRTDPRWAALASTPDASLFTSPPWIRAICDTYGFTPRARLLTDPAGSPIGGFGWIPITDFRGDRLVSLPFSDRAEPFVSDLTAWSRVADDLIRGDVPLRLRCFDRAVPVADVRLERTSEAAWHGTNLGIQLVDLHASLSHQARRNINIAHRNGVIVEVSDSLDALRTYHRLHVALRKYKYRLLAQPFTFFERLWEEFSARDGIATLLAYADGEPIAGAVYLLWNGVAYYKFAASRADRLTLRPNDALAWAAMRWATERGMHRLDWGLSDLDQPGLVSFKRKFASDERRIVSLVSEPPATGQDQGEPLGELTRVLTADSVPDHVTELAGSLLYRYFT
jgi:CelD/BcsL family acetyltransferase involved in cellulose biosynthesis